MQRLFYGLVNGSFGDPGLHLELGGEGALFDLGDLMPLKAARIHRVREVFVTHAHLDHFFGFDWLLRIFLGEERRIRIYGPEGLAERVRSKLAGYTWNIEMDFGFEAEVHEVLDRHALVSRFRCQHGLEGDLRSRERPLEGGVLAETPTHRVRAVPVEHGTPCLAFAYEQKRGLHVLEEGLARLGLERGPWLRELKRAVLGGEPADTAFEADGRTFPLGQLAAELTVEVPSVKVAYVADTVFTDAVCVRVAELAQGARTFFCEAKYVERDREKAAAARHLTARQAAELARAGSVGELCLFHPSPKYQRRYEELLEEARAVFPRTIFQANGGFLKA